jgi:hypothetical protein
MPQITLEHKEPNIANIYVDKQIAGFMEDSTSKGRIHGYFAPRVLIDEHAKLNNLIISQVSLAALYCPFETITYWEYTPYRTTRRRYFNICITTISGHTLNIEVMKKKSGWTAEMAECLREISLRDSNLWEEVSPARRKVLQEAVATANLLPDFACEYTKYD